MSDAWETKQRELEAMSARAMTLHDACDEALGILNNLADPVVGHSPEVDAQLQDVISILNRVV
jgi:hypothetical protein